MLFLYRCEMNAILQIEICYPQCSLVGLLHGSSSKQINKEKYTQKKKKIS